MSLHINAAILTVSDTAALDESADRSGPTIQQILSDNSITVVENGYRIVPDEKDAIQAAVKGWVARREPSIDWIITTGGTGFGIRDITPEAVAPLLDRQAPGLVHLLIASSLKHTPRAVLARPVAGTAGKTLIVTLPGSTKAVKECLEALLSGGIINHAIDLNRGGTGQKVHAAMGVGHGGSHASGKENSDSPSHNREHHHSCGHDHGHVGHRPPKPRSGAALSHDPNAPASARHRQSPYPIIKLEEALQQLDEKIERLPVEIRKVDSNLRGYVLAEDVFARHNVPSTATTSVDGYALRSTDPPGVYKVVTSASHILSEHLPSGTIYRINTGGPLPAGTDTIIMVEDTKLVTTFGDSGEEKEVETLAQIPAGENVRSPGSDVRQGDLVLKAGERILSVGGEVGTLAFVGRTEVKVYRKPIVALLSTGNELIDLQNPESLQGGDSWGGIFDTNRPSLQAVLEGFGYQVVDLGIVQDTVEAHVQAIQRGLTEADLILTTGGTSMGPTDLLKPVIERNFNGTIHFGRVAIKPGKPTTFATVPAAQKEEAHKPIFALPGNPASALVTFYVFVIPALRALGGWPHRMKNLPHVRVKVKSPMPFDPRAEFHRVVIKVQPQTGVLEAWSTGGQRSSRVASLSGANGFVVLPSLALAPHGTKKRYEVGDWADAIIVGELQPVDC